MEAILVIDTGSSSMRGILFDKEGKIRIKEQRKYFMSVKEDGTAEYDADDFYDCLLDICKSSVKRASDTDCTISALAFTSQRSSILPLSYDGKPLSKIITWYDKRSLDICTQLLKDNEDYIYDRTGTRLTPVLSAPKMTWLQHNCPLVYDAADKIVGIHDLLLFIASGLKITDTSLASRTSLMDIQKLEWSDELIRLFGLDKDKLCDLKDPGDIIGPITSRFSELTGLAPDTLVISAGGDQQCSALGQGLMDSSRAGITVGTGSYVCSVMDKPYVDPQKRINTNSAVIPGHWTMEASTLSSGSVYDWFNNTFYKDRDPKEPMKLINQEVCLSPPGARGILMFPSLAGRGCPDWNDHASGVFYGLRLSSQRCDLARAVLEGIAAEIADCFKTINEIDTDIRSVSITGGLSKFDEFDQIVSDMIEFPIERCKIEETTAIGAFIAASTSLNWFSSFQEAYEIFSVSGNEEIFMPKHDRVMTYRRSNKARQELQFSLPDRSLSKLLAEV